VKAEISHGARHPAERSWGRLAIRGGLVFSPSLSSIKLTGLPIAD